MPDKNKTAGGEPPDEKGVLTSLEGSPADDLGSGQNVKPISSPEGKGGEAPSEERLDRDLNLDYDILRDADNKKQWLDLPTYADQFIRYPNTVYQEGPFHFEVNYGDPDAVKQLGIYLRGASNPAAPLYTVKEIRSSFWERGGHHVTLYSITKIKYLKIVEKGD